MNLNDNDTNKERVVAFLLPDTIEKMTHLEAEHQLKNHSEFIQEAVKFYIGFLASGDATEFLSATLHRTLNDSLLVMPFKVPPGTKTITEMAPTKSNDRWHPREFCVNVFSKQTKDLLK